MKLKKILSIMALAVVVASCNKPAGELVGVGAKGNFNEANPYGMVYIKGGSFMMGENAQSALFAQQDRNMMVTVDPFWMDETEITNDEYKQFVAYCRDSMALRLAVLNGLEEEYALGVDEDDFEPETCRLNWKQAKNLWTRYRREYAGRLNDGETDLLEAIAPMFYNDMRSLKNTYLHYSYNWLCYDELVSEKNKYNVKKGRYTETPIIRADSTWEDEHHEIHRVTVHRQFRNPSDLVSNNIIAVYPDTLVWVRDFAYSYNDPLLQHYFSHPGYANYPVVGVTWEQAYAFCHWRTKTLYVEGKQLTQAYRLPTEAEWEYAARGGRRMAAYPWGSNYARDSKGCYMANYKPYRSSYNEDTGTYTVAVASYRPNDFGLYDMAGNVAEWTSSMYTNKKEFTTDLNPTYEYMAREEDAPALKRKVVKGGSWKDISAYLQCGARTYEYQDEGHSYIGFRCIRSHVGQ